MATKIKTMKLLQEWRSLTELHQRPLSQKSPAFCVPQFRPPTFQASLPIRKLDILVDPKELIRRPQPVRIILLKSPPNSVAQAL